MSENSRMIVLGINAFSYNPSACLVRDGRLTSFCQEERLNRLKGSYGLFPSKSIDWCLSSQGLKLGDVDRIAFCWGCDKYPSRMLFSLAKSYAGQFGRRRMSERSSIGVDGGKWAALEMFQIYLPNQVRRKIRDFLRANGHKGPIPRIEFAEHHLSHAFQAYYQSPFEQAIALVADGSGENNCVSGYRIDNDSYKKVLGYDIPQSLGWYYGGFTAYLGFIANRDEGKLMGLASLGASRKCDNPWIERLQKIIRVSNDGFEIDPLYFKFGGNEYHPRFTDHLVKYVTSFNSDMFPVGLNEHVDGNLGEMNRYLLDNYVDLAYAAQFHLEEAMLTLVRRLVAQTGLRNLCLSGGIAMNCKANGRIADERVVDAIFVHPASADEGACIGAAFYVARQNGDNPRNVLKNAQLGPSFSNTEIEKTLRAAKVEYRAHDDVCSAAISMLREGKIIGWFHGGLEMGARALGGRSIIARADLPNMKHKVNSEVKAREPWRPYAPSLTAESAGRYFDNSIDTPFMILARDANDTMKKMAPAVVHTDGSTRPQTVSAADLPKWHRLLGLAGKEFGAPILLNTSFNVRGEPIVCTPSDAIRCFYSTGLDALVIEDFILEKNRTPHRA
jgi:carbamoyltransferase